MQFESASNSVVEINEAATLLDTLFERAHARPLEFDVLSAALLASSASALYGRGCTVAWCAAVRQARERADAGASTLGATVRPRTVTPILQHAYAALFSRLVVYFLGQRVGMR